MPPLEHQERFFKSLIQMSREADVQIYGHTHAPIRVSAVRSDVLRVWYRTYPRAFAGFLPRWPDAPTLGEDGSYTSVATESLRLVDSDTPSSLLRRCGLVVTEVVDPIT